MTPSPFHGIFSAFSQEYGGIPTTQATSKLPVEQASVQQPVAASAGSAPVGQIAVDIYEVDNYYIIRAPIAGVKLSDLDIEVDGKIVTLRGRRTTDDVQPNQFYVQECFWGEFSRSITMPTSIDPRRIKATFSKDSVLKILIPKEEKVKIVRINSED